MIVFQNKLYKIISRDGYYILQSKDGGNNQYFMTLPAAKKAIGINIV